MRVPEARFPEAFQVIPSSVIRSRKFDIVRSRLAGNAALVTHWLHDALSVFHNHHGRKARGEYARVSRLQFGSLQIVKLAFGPRNLVSRDALVFRCRFGNLSLQGSFRIGQTFALLEQFLFKLSSLVRIESANERCNLSLLFILWIRESIANLRTPFGQPASARRLLTYCLRGLMSTPTIFKVASMNCSSGLKSSAHSSPSHRTVMPLCFTLGLANPVGCVHDKNS
ncbi:hypothetical protein BN2475_90104 [Paraburkholderia ribeironis]|uniref:Uncharacterized protein n=1 Tax=Paraburkholderia ribeironis TaxID=1247936 RepID=A0A1N7RN79_9BURK|nr:hypothetical protein BN2475_90104 [Paraburkholderia ribeironis]